MKGKNTSIRKGRKRGCREEGIEKMRKKTKGHGKKLR